MDAWNWAIDTYHARQEKIDKEKRLKKKKEAAKF